MPKNDFIGQQLKNNLMEHFSQYASMSLLDFSTSSEIICQVSDSFLDFLTRYRDSVYRWLNECLEGNYLSAREDLLQSLVDSTIDFIQDKNQFISIGSKETNELNAVYENFLADLRKALLLSSPKEEITKGIERVFATFQKHLASFMNGLADPNENLPWTFNQPLCREYSPELQLNILHAHPEQMLEPILDLGCGQKAELVHYLQNQSKMVMGIDRLTSASHFIIKADWLTCPLGTSCWGTVISHLGLSNHFLHHHLRRGGHPDRYARRYMEVLYSLKPKGSFLYAPGLPFIEDLLPGDDYLIEKYPISALAGGPIDAHFRDKFGISVLYACKVTRLGK